MSRAPARIGVELAISVVAAATMWFTLLSWRGFTRGSELYAGQLCLVALVIVAIGTLGRWRRVPTFVVWAAQVVVVGAIVCLFLGPLPLPTSEVFTALSNAARDANTYQPPVPYGAGVSVQPLLLVGGAVALIFMDLIAAGLRQVPMAGLPLLVVYTLPISLLEQGPSWVPFVITAVGFLSLLFMQEQIRLAAWGRTLDPGGQPLRKLSESARVGAVGVSATALAAAVVAPWVIPTLDIDMFNVGSGPGGNDDVTINNPMVDLRRDLVRGDDVPLITIQTDQPRPSHLRISALNRFSGTTWSSGNRDLPGDNLADGDVPSGVPSDVPQQTYDYQVSVTNAFHSTWLPTQAPISQIDAAGEWRYDDTVMDFIAGNDDLSAAGMEYSMTAVAPDYTEDELINARPGTNVPEELLELPGSVGDSVTSLARSVTENAPTPFAKAAVLQNWFREDGGFTYDLAQAESSGPIGSTDLENFLDPANRRGYCEQFAAAFAVMARVLDIPSRVAVGFLEPTQVGANTYEYSSHDLHAWVELYFEDVGWVMFDPTPPSRAANGVVPSYTDQFAPGPDEGPSETPSSATPSGAPSTSEPTQQPSQAPAVTPEAETTDVAASGNPWGWVVPVLVGLGVVALVLVLAFTPRTLRERQRARRLASGPEGAWDEVRATCVDLGLEWPTGRSPHETEESVVAFFAMVGDVAERPARGRGRAPEAEAALDSLARAVERLRFARPGSASAQGSGEWTAAVQLCADALVAGCSPRARRRAVWWPRSVVARSTTQNQGPTEQADSDEPTLVDHL